MTQHKELQGSKTTVTEPEKDSGKKKEERKIRIGQGADDLREMTETRREMERETAASVDDGRGSLSTSSRSFNHRLFPCTYPSVRPFIHASIYPSLFIDNSSIFLPTNAKKAPKVSM